jgi:hypothetical protein
MTMSERAHDNARHFAEVLARRKAAFAKMEADAVNQIVRDNYRALLSQAERDATYWSRYAASFSK